MPNADDINRLCRIVNSIRHDVRPLDDATNVRIEMPTNLGNFKPIRKTSKTLDPPYNSSDHRFSVLW